jgi:putative two-component system response regulator
MGAVDDVIPLFHLLDDPDFRFDPDALGQPQIVLVDDEPTTALLAQRMLERAGFAVQAFSGPGEALEAIRAEPGMTVLVTDMHMPGMSGLDLGVAAQEVDPDLPVILLTGAGDEATAQRALRQGASDYLIKPPDPHELVRAVQRAAYRRASGVYQRSLVSWMKDELARRGAVIRELTLNTLTTVVRAMDARSDHFVGHSRAVSLQAAAIAQALGLRETAVEAIRTAGLLHDIGMIGVPDSITSKAGKLTDREYAVIREHPLRGAEILAPMKHLEHTVRFVREHHERYDGSGYPDRKVGNEISIGGQVLGIAEAWVGMMESRAYRAGCSREEAMSIIQSSHGFSTDVVDALKRSDIGVIGIGIDGDPAPLASRPRNSGEAVAPRASASAGRSDTDPFHLHCADCGQRVPLGNLRRSEGATPGLDVTCPACLRSGRLDTDAAVWLHAAPDHETTPIADDLPEPTAPT